MNAFSTRIFVITVSLISNVQACFSQGTFVNLDFEQAKIIPIIGNPYYPYAVASTNALPGWAAYIGGTRTDVIHYDDVSLGAAWVSIHDTNGFEPILQGRYTVLLQPSFPGGANTAAIGQFGTLPSNAHSLTFYGNGAYNVTFGGQPISLVSLSATANYTIFAGDISPFAGQTGELMFQGGGLLDNIQFSSSQIPEPGGLALFGVGTLLVALCRRRES